MLEKARQAALEIFQEAADDGSVADGPSRQATAGVAGNMRRTSAIGLVLLVLLSAEAATTIALGALLPVHIALGLLLLAPLALKLGSTSWRMVRYYSGTPDYVRRGPPSSVLRMLAPLLVLSTITLFGSGVALVESGTRGGLLGTVHVVSFVTWGVLVLVHILAYGLRASRVGRLDWQRSRRNRLSGAVARRALLAGGLTIGVVVAVTLYPHGSEAPGERGMDDSPLIALRQALP